MNNTVENKIKAYKIDLQIACKETLPISSEQLIAWVQLTLKTHLKTAELTLRLASIAEMTILNKLYRKQNKPTNVLAFPSTIPNHIILKYPLLGDVIVCPAVLQTESIAQGRSLESHWAHIIIHGVLHLLGYDHIKEEEAQIMQAIEINLLTTLGFPNPYH